MRQSYYKDIQNRLNLNSFLFDYEINGIPFRLSISVMIQTEICFVYNQQENCQYDYTSFNLKGNGDLFLCVKLVKMSQIWIGINR